MAKGEGSRLGSARYMGEIFPKIVFPKNRKNHKGTLCFFNWEGGLGEIYPQKIDFARYMGRGQTPPLDMYGLNFSFSTQETQKKSTITTTTVL